jgi:DNA polymerase epsilon subunit 2
MIVAMTVASGDIAHDAPWLIIANCHLDSPVTLSRIRSLLAGLALPICKHYHKANDVKYDGSFSPKRPVIAFLGDFSSSTIAHHGISVTDEHQRQFGELGTCLCAPELNIDSECVASLADLVFIPGPNDPVAGSSEALPRARLLQQVVQPLIDRIKVKTNGIAPIFTTSPARLRYGNDEEIVIHRDDVLRKLRQLSRRISSGVDSSGLFDASVHLAKTLLDQGHLAPFTSAFAPKYWNYDHALRLYPPPSILCLSDNTAPSFETVYNNATVFNPGNFACEGSFVLFRPNMANIEISKVL